MLAVTGSFVCCSVVVLFACCCVVLLDNRDLQSCWCWSCGVVACKDNNKVGGCSDAVLLTVMVVRLLWECGFLVGLEDRERGWERERTPTRALPR